MNVLITGANGQLGQCIRQLADEFPMLDMACTDVDKLDITRQADLETYFQEHTVDFLVNCAAYTAVDKAEEEPVKATLINETAAKALPWEDPLGKELVNWRDTCIIVGILKDFHQHSLHQEIMPLQLFLNEQRRTVSVKISGNNLNHTISEIKRVKESFSNRYPFIYSFFDEEFDKAYKVERKTREMAEFFTIITIIIACLGLYGLATFTAEQRIKEVGIRKVMGAPVYQLVYMLSKDFTIPVFFSFLISVPIAYYLMKNWLNGFAYHIEIGVFHFLLTLILMVLIAWITISFRTFRVASLNPVNSLRHE